MLIDSTNITEVDIKNLLKHCKKSKEDKIVIIHGTDTMVDTAKLLEKSIINKTIVLTGALIPYTFGNSDGLFNLSSALAFVQTLPYGVYISMHGKYFNWDNVRKNKQTGEFDEIY
jgi:L-asparaginase